MLDAIGPEAGSYSNERSSKFIALDVWPFDQVVPGGNEGIPDVYVTPIGRNVVGHFGVGVVALNTQLIAIAPDGCAMKQQRCIRLQIKISPYMPNPWRDLKQQRLRQRLFDVAQ